MSIARLVCCAVLPVLVLAGCGEPLREDVIAQARPDGQIAFDVVKIDDRVLDTVLAEPPAKFHERFRKYQPPPELKIAVGDTLSVVIWESADNGLFGNSLTELTFPAGAAARVMTERGSDLLGTQQQRPQDLTASAETLRQLFGGAGQASSTGPLAINDLGVAASSATGPILSAPALARAATSADLNSPDAASGLAAGGTGTLGGAGLAAGAAARPNANASGLAAPGIPGLGGAVAPDTAAQRLRSPMSAEAAAAGRLDELLELAGKSGRPGTRLPDQMVGADGAISVPYAGRIAVAGQTAAEAERKIERLLRTKALDPQVIIATSRSAANTVSIEGEVVGGKRIPLSPGGDRLLQVIAAAGGAKAPPHETFVELSRGGVTASLPLAMLIAEPSEDIYAEPGDVLTLVRRPKTFSVFGAAGKNIAITFNSDRLSLTEALAKAGGLRDDRADPSAVFLFRYEPVHLVEALGQPIASAAPRGVSPIAYRLDLSDAKSYLLAKRFPVHDQDVIFVANAESVPVNRLFLALSRVVGPVETAFVTCHYYGKC